MRIVESLVEYISRCSCGVIIAHECTTPRQAIKCPGCSNLVELTDREILIAEIKPVIPKMIEDKRNG